MARASYTASLGGEQIWRFQADGTSLGLFIDGTGLFTSATKIVFPSESCYSPIPVPDGRFGAGIRVSKVGSSGSSIRLTWDVSTCQAAAYHLIYGELSGVADYTLDGARCDLGSQGVVNWTTVPTGNIWFVVIGDDGEGTEGSWGQDSGEADRNRSISSGFCGNSLRDNAGTCPPSP